MSDIQLNVGDVIEVTTERLAYGGEAIARFHGMAIFIPLAAPEESLRVRITEKRKRFARAVIEEILKPSLLRIEPRCRYFGQCGGCHFQHLPYETQLQAKIGFIRDALQRIGKLDWPQEIQILSAEEFNYRLRAKVKIENRLNHDSKECAKASNLDRDQHQPVKIGFYRMNSHEVCDVERCEILLPELNEALLKIRDAITGPQEKNLNRINEIEIAVSQSMPGDSRNRNTFADISVHPSISGFSNAPVERLVAGSIYQFEPTSFFQVNARLLDEFVRQAVGPVHGGLAFDLYAGVGLFTVPLADRFQKVIGVEANQSAVGYANKNIATNKISNAEIVCERVDKWLQTYAAQKSPTRPDLIVLDPPRSGASEAIEWIATLSPPRIHYISCDPMTLARDLKSLNELEYQIERIIAIDMFPQTYHVETIVYLTRR
jgi:23S rRNA (uracil1939-C5)-methyltransferase